MFSRLTLSFSVLFLSVSPVMAETVMKYGSTVVTQQTSQRSGSINKPVIGSVDLSIDADFGPGMLHLYAEGSSTPAVSASSVISGTNFDAGTAVDRNGKGRLQLSEFSYELEHGSLLFLIGVRDLTAISDATTVADDEGEQFLAADLVRNPTIPFPDYTPTLQLRYQAENGLSAMILVASGYGLGDNPSAGYRDLFSFGRDKVTGLKKGVISIGELRMPTDTGMTFGGWYRSSELPEYLSAATRSRAFGLYGCFDGEMDERTRWSARVGWNSAKATDEVVSHASFAVEHAYTKTHVIALGASINGLSSDFKRTYANAANPFMVETYYRWQINEFIGISPDIQYWKNANGLSRATAAMAGGAAWVYGLRLQIGASHHMME